MRLPTNRSSTSPAAGGPGSVLPWTHLARLLAGGVVCAGLVWGAGRALERGRLGPDEEAARRRVEADVRKAFDEMARSLQTMARPLADGGTLRAAAEGDTAAARRLFEAADAALGGFAPASPRGPIQSVPADVQTSDLAVTAYHESGRPVAWTGRPSELPSDRLQGPEAWFFAQGALGLRLVYVTPVTDGTDGRRIGIVASERALSSSAGVRAAGEDAFQFHASIAPVSIQLNFESARTRAVGTTFDVNAPSGARLLTAIVAPADLAYVRQQWRRGTLSLALIALAAAVLLLAGPLLDWRNFARSPAPYVTSTALVVAVIVAGRLLLRLASLADWTEAAIFSAATYASPLLGPLLTSPFDFLITAVAAGSLVALGLFATEEWRIASWRRRTPLSTTGRRAAYAATHLSAGVALAVLLVSYERFLRDTIGNTTLDLLHFSLHPWDSAAPRLALQSGLIIWHATALAFAVLLLRAASIPWCVPRRNWMVRAATIILWAAPLAAWELGRRGLGPTRLPSLVAAAAVITATLLATRLRARYRHGSQAFRLITLTLGLVAPALVFYPAVFQMAWRAKTQLIETRYAPQAIKQRQTIQTLLNQSLSQIDAFPGLADLLEADPVQPATSGSGQSSIRSGQGPSIDQAFQVWRVTGLAAYPLTSSVELYAADGTLVSRFAFNLPEDLTAAQRWQEPTCEWEIFEEVSPFFAEERRVLHAGRAVCGSAGVDAANRLRQGRVASRPDQPVLDGRSASSAGRPGGPPKLYAKADGQRIGSIVVHVMLDYGNLPFIASRSPYVELLRPSNPLRGEGISGRDVEYAVYGWSRTPLYSSGETAWPLEDPVFARVVDSRTPVWAELQRGDTRYDVYLLNDRGGIYAVGFPVVSPLGHLVNLAEVTVLAWLTYLLLLALSAIFGTISRRGTSARALLREIRVSFYRKLFIAFVLAAVVPVVALAVVTRTYFARQMRANIELEAVRTASAARRVVEDLAAPRAAQQGVGVDDNLMVWVSRLIDQDVNIFVGPRLVATSARNLFASGLLPTRTPSAVYHALVLRMDASTVTRERIGGDEYMVAATAINARQLEALLTVPLTSRQQVIEQEIDTLDRRVLLAALLCILAGAGIGYYMAERIADPVSRLTRATRRIARGDLDARITATSSDELRRLVEDFNRMARELQRQQKELERTHRLEAWAEMARQVAHEIKNPLTPIQLNAEHLRRVHADRGEPLGPVLQECVGTILTQVKLLRQIAAEFSSFASSPTARPTEVDVADLLREVVDPYRSGSGDRIQFNVDVPPDLPRVHVDRTLIARALTNVVENALHAMPGRGTLTIVGRHTSQNGAVNVRVSDTGVGMEAEALSRVFEPYFSTKATGTGLGLPIAKRNVELSGGTIAVSSERDRGTTVEITLPVSHEASPH